jgi:exodeoxyribonuclease VII large subunit
MALREAAIGKIIDRCQKDRYLRILNGKEQNLEEKMLRFNNLKPENVLRKGYTITEDAEGNVIKGINAMKLGDLILTRFIDGSTQSQVKSKEGAN